MKKVQHTSSYWPESYEDWVGALHPSILRFPDVLIDPGKESFQGACELARHKTGRRGAPWGCVLAVYVQATVGPQASNVFVGQTRAGNYYLRMTWGGRRIQRALTPQEEEVAVRFDRDCNLPPKVVRVTLDLGDGSWRYAPGKPGHHDNAASRGDRSDRTGGTRCAPKSNSAKTLRDKMRKRLIAEASQERQQTEHLVQRKIERKFSG